MKNCQSAPTGSARPTAHGYTLLLLGEGILVGLFAGLVVVLYRYCLTWAEALLFFIQDLIRGNALSVLFWFLVLAGLALAANGLLRWEPMAGASGVPQVMEETKGRLEENWLRVLIARISGGTICILGGLSMGRSGPSIHLGTMAARGFLRLRDRIFPSRAGRERLLLLSCGAGAGLAAAFQVPLAGILFVLEEIHRSFDRTLLTAGLAASLTADVVASFFFGAAPIFHYRFASLPLSWYWLLIPFGILCGLAGAGYNASMLGAQTLFRSMKKIPVTVRFIAVFFVAGAAGLFLPRILGGGNAMVTLLEVGRPALSTLLLLLLAKFIFSGVSFGSGLPGGIFFPLLTLGSFLGAVCGALAVDWLPLDGSHWPLFIALGMAGLFAGILRTPVTAVVLVAEMTGAADHLPELCIVALLACATASLTGNRPIYDSLSERFTAGLEKAE